jgi:NADPH:quinone reductase-like Zn-dependent oxidoreductase
VRAVRYDRYGPPHVLRIVEAPLPHAGPGQIRIAVYASAVNGIDWKLRSGAFPDAVTFPAGTGTDAAGIVDEVGAGVAGVSLGEPVFGSGPATCAQFAVLENWARRPDDISFAEAAGYPIPVETALRILRELAIGSGSTLLVNGASGGVGAAVLQLARVKRIATVGIASARNHPYLREFGAIPVAYGPGLVDRVRAAAPSGVNAAVDVAGSGVIPELIELTGDAGQVLSIADFTAPEFGARVSYEVSNAAQAYTAAAEFIASGQLRLPVAAEFAMTDAAQAHALSQSGHAAGRVIIRVRAEDEVVEPVSVRPHGTIEA